MVIFRGTRRTQVVVPAEPAAVAGVDVHDNVGQVKLLEGVCDTLAVAGGGVLAGLEVAVGDQVGQGVGLDDQGDSSLGVLLEDGDDSCWLLDMPIVSTWRVCDTHGQCTPTCIGRCCLREALRWRLLRRSHGRADRR